MRKPGVCIVILLLLPLSQTLRAAESCAAEEHRQFYFWLGKWTAYSVDGNKQGTNHLHQVMGKCAVQENWQARGFKGTSLNFYDPVTKQWRQTWVDNGGGRLHLSGSFNGEFMHMSGARQTEDGKTIVDRITWTPLAYGRVRQYWQSSEDDGKTWQDTFDGYYQRDAD